MNVTWMFLLGLLLLPGAIAAQHPAPVNKAAPATPCVGGEDCDSGANLCKPIPSAGLTGSLVLSDSNYSVTSDGLGPYVHGRANVVAVAQNAAVLLFHPLQQRDTSPMRRIKVDLTHPVPGGGGVRLGIFADSLWVDVNAQWYTEADFAQHSLFEIPIDSTVFAQQLDVGFSINGVAHALQMGPQPWGHCYANGTAVHGAGTTRATITRTSERSFVVDLPSGSVGRLFDVHLHDPHAVDRGLYYVSLRYVVRP